jgi:hypothetical protein
VNRYLEQCPYCGADPGGDRTDRPEVEAQPPSGVVATTEPYRPLQSLAVFVQLMFVLFIVASVVVVVTAWSYRGVLLDLASNVPVLMDDAIRAEDSYVTASGLLGGANVFLAGAFIVWFWRAYSNLVALGRPRKRRAGWAIGSWFVPIGNFFIPYGIGAEIWKESTDDIGGTTETNLEPVISWWALFLIMGLVNQIAFFAGSDAGDDREKLAAIAGLDVLASVVAIAAAIAAIRFVRLATQRQESLSDRSIIWRDGESGDVGGWGG